MFLAPNTRLGPYEIVAPLGAGGMGEVYRARDPRLGRDVAIKVLPADVATHPDRLARFEREARAVASLNHPNIVVLHSVEDAAGIRFLTMELVEGRALDHEVVPGGMALPRVIELGIACAEALGAAHEKGVIHRDFKPANVMVTREGRVKVVDFGLARSNGDAPSAQSATMATPLSGAGLFVGTAPYMAPEQIRGENVDARTDLFALGVVLYEIASGQRPFAGATVADTVSAILRDVPDPLARRRADLPDDLGRIVERCLAKDPRDRFQAALDVANELRGLRARLQRGEIPSPTPPAAEKVASIAVLPFVNRSASVDDEYFSDGLADELLNVLAKIHGLRVIARTSSFQFKGTKEDIPTIGTKLDVATVLEGSVRRSGTRVRISVQLVRVADSSHLWSETYDRTLEDIFAVQDDIAQSVVKELRTALLGQRVDSDASGKLRAEVSNATKGRTDDPEAHRLFLLSRHLRERIRPDETAKAIEYLEQALERDPRFALAWIELGSALAAQADFGWTPLGEGYRRGREAVEHGLGLEPDLAEGHAVLGWIRMCHDWDWAGAQASYARGLELEPGNQRILRGMSALAAMHGRFEEAIVFTRRALELDPLDARSLNAHGYYLYLGDRWTEAEEAFHKTLELAPERGVTPGMLALTLLARGRIDEARGWAEREPVETLHLWILAVVEHAAGRRAESDAALAELIERHGDDFAFQVAQVHAARGEADAAFEWLERAYVHRDSGLADLKATPELRSLHGDPRWSALVRKLRLGD